MGWTNSLQMGIKEIDEQHQVLFDVIARLEQAIDDEARWSAVHYAIVELDDFVRIHFSVEEALMRLHGYAGLDAHVAEHREFTDRLQLIKQQSIQRDVSDDVTELIKSWLTNHIDKVDRAYVSHLRTAPVAGRSGG